MWLWIQEAEEVTNFTAWPYLPKETNFNKTARVDIEVKGAKMEALEALNLKVRGSLFSLTNAQLADVATFLKQEVTGKSLMELIAAILQHLDSEALAQKDDDGGLSTVSALEDYITLLKDKPDSTNTNTNTDDLSALLKAMEDDFLKKKAEIIASLAKQSLCDKSKDTPVHRVFSRRNLKSVDRSAR